MLDEPHDLVSELPEYGARIEALRVSDKQFRDLHDSYNALDTHIQDIELAGTPVDDVHAENLKKRRLVLKDELFKMLVAVPA